MHSQLKTESLYVRIEKVSHRSSHPQPGTKMVIKFTCPEGHPLTCSDKQAGKSAKCPKCGSGFVVPDESLDSDGADYESDDYSDAIAEVIAADSGPLDVPISDQPPTGDSIAFLCPNGHRLNGPKSLQGRPGQCPHCGEKFKIPDYDEEEAEAGDSIPVGTIVDDDDIDIEDLEQIEQYSEDGGLGTPTFPTSKIPIAEAVDVPQPPPPPGNGHPLAQLFTQLWSKKEKGCVVEIYLEQGELFPAEHYSIDMSRQSHGVFATKEDDGSFTVTTIPWESIHRIGIRKLKALPAGLFK